ncbi:hypothetical protein HHI36_022378 [Cryptolaemus montrouzieri]|uniref:Uncharacterized protein n=1 Tax=Cryptolaemus montrouzieri TaxID=559131 RepID=A0ABD2MZH4_9CUCU
MKKPDYGIENAKKSIHTWGGKNTEAWRFIRASATEKQDKACIRVITLNEWMRHYEKLLTEDRQEYRIDIEHNINFEEEPVEVAPETVKETITNLKNGRASGPEGVPAELLKNGTEKLYRILTKVMNECLNGRKAINGLNEVSWSNTISKDRKFTIYDTMVKSTLLYGSETWRIG